MAPIGLDRDRTGVEAMSDFYNENPIKATRKVYHCFECSCPIPSGAHASHGRGSTQVTSTAGTCMLTAPPLPAITVKRTTSKAKNGTA